MRDPDARIRWNKLPKRTFKNRVMYNFFYFLEITQESGEL